MDGPFFFVVKVTMPASVASLILVLVALALVIGCGAGVVARETCYKDVSARYAPQLDECTMACDGLPPEEVDACEDPCLDRVQSSERQELKGCR